MSILLKLIFATQLLALVSAINVNITENITDYDLSYALPIGNVTVNSNKYWSVTNTQSFGVTGPLKIDGGGALFVTNGSPNNALKVSISDEGDHSNAGTISFDSTASILEKSEYVITSNFFHNSGMAHFRTSNSKEPAVSIFETKNWKNSKMVSFYAPPTAARGIVKISTKTLMNNGNICLYNHYLEQTYSQGTGGTITLFENSEFELNSDLAFNHKVVLKNSTSVLSAKGDASMGPEFKWEVYGFGNGNKIKLLNAIEQWEYDEGSGLLTLHDTNGSQKNFNITKGYDKMYFKIVQTVNVDDTIIYDNPVPSGAIYQDKITCYSEPIQKPPGAHCTEYTTTEIETVDDLVTTVEKGVLVTTNSEGNFFVTTRVLGEESSTQDDSESSMYVEPESTSEEVTTEDGADSLTDYSSEVIPTGTNDEGEEEGSEEDGTDIMTDYSSEVIPTGTNDDDEEEGSEEDGTDIMTDYSSEINPTGINEEEEEKTGQGAEAETEEGEEEKNEEEETEEGEKVGEGEE
ncbi:hypothetical protein G210_1471, partial [Candida maltosa Xu316]